MYVFGHLGLGYLLVKPWWKRLPLRSFFVGCLFPDLLDKPVYYIWSAYSGLRGAEAGLISGTRTFGHTLLVLVLFLALAAWQRSRRALAFCAGMGTHLLLDNFADLVTGGSNSNFAALLWPYPNGNFPVIPYANLATQLARWGDSQFLFFELCGILVLAYMAYTLKRA